MWVPYRVHPADLGNQVLQILRGHAQLTALDLASMRGIQDPDVLWVGHRAGRTAAH
jgi:hypothetical protein